MEYTKMKRDELIKRSKGIIVPYSVFNLTPMDLLNNREQSQNWDKRIEVNISYFTDLRDNLTKHYITVCSSCKKDKLCDLHSESRNTIGEVINCLSSCSSFIGVLSGEPTHQVSEFRIVDGVFDKNTELMQEQEEKITKIIRDYIAKNVAHSNQNIDINNDLNLDKSLDELLNEDSEKIKNSFFESKILDPALLKKRNDVLKQWKNKIDEIKIVGKGLQQSYLVNSRLILTLYENYEVLREDYKQDIIRNKNEMEKKFYDSIKDTSSKLIAYHLNSDIPEWYAQHISEIINDIAILKLITKDRETINNINESESFFSIFLKNSESDKNESFYKEMEFLEDSKNVLDIFFEECKKIVQVKQDLPQKDNFSFEVNRENFVIDNLIVNYLKARYCLINMLNERMNNFLKIESETNLISKKSQIDFNLKMAGRVKEEELKSLFETKANEDKKELDMCINFSYASLSDAFKKVTGQIDYFLRKDSIFELENYFEDVKKYCKFWTDIDEKLKSENYYFKIAEMCAFSKQKGTRNLAKKYFRKLGEQYENYLIALDNLSPICANCHELIPENEPNPTCCPFCNYKLKTITLAPSNRHSKIKKIRHCDSKQSKTGTPKNEESVDGNLSIPEEFYADIEQTMIDEDRESEQL